jgi:hypothetical protein
MGQYTHLKLACVRCPVQGGILGMVEDIGVRPKLKEEPHAVGLAVDRRGVDWSVPVCIVHIRVHFCAQQQIERCE